MFAAEIERAIAGAPRVRLAEISSAVWKGFACGAIAESDAQRLAELIEVRKTIPVAPPAPRRVGSRPRSPESMERRRRWTSSGWLPPAIAARFTLAEVAVLAVVAAEIAKAGRCALPIEAVAARAGVSRSTVKTALREARVLGLISIEHRPVQPFRHLPNVVRIVSPEWQSWISMRRSSQGVKSSTPTSTHIHSREGEGRSEPQTTTTWKRSGRLKRRRLA